MRVKVKKGETSVGLNINNWSQSYEQRELALWSVHASLSVHIPRNPFASEELGVGDLFSLPTKPRGDYTWDAVSQLMPRKRKPSLLPHPPVLGSLSLSPLKLLPQIQMAWRQLLLVVSIPIENSAPSITSIAITSNSPHLWIPHPIVGYRLQPYIFSCLLLPISITWMWLSTWCSNSP